MERLTQAIEDLCRNQHHLSEKLAAAEKQQAEIKVLLLEVKAGVDKLEQHVLTGNGHESLLVRTARLEEQVGDFSAAEKTKTDGSRFLLTTVLSIVGTLIAVGALIVSCHH